MVDAKQWSVTELSSTAIFLICWRLKREARETQIKNEVKIWNVEYGFAGTFGISHRYSIVLSIETSNPRTSVLITMAAYRFSILDSRLTRIIPKGCDDFRPTGLTGTARYGTRFRPQRRRLRLLGGSIQLWYPYIGNMHTPNGIRWEFLPFFAF
jgi:hypothetical protein